MQGDTRNIKMSMTNKVVMINPRVAHELYRSFDPDLGIFLALNLKKRLMNSG